MTITVNGEARALSVATLADLVAAFGFDPAAGGLAIAVNGEIVGCETWTDARINAGDEIEIIRAVQGG